MTQKYRLRFFVFYFLLSTFYCLLSSGCAGKRVNIDPSNPVYAPKNEFDLHYGFFITPNEKKIGYLLEDYPKLLESIKPFNEINTLAEFRRFENHFWDIRDTDLGTPQNEFKELIDSRIQDIKNEIFAADIDIPLTRFDRNSGLKGDMARVYLLRGAPSFKAKFSGTYMELMTWYYFDPYGRPLFRFLFYKKFDRFVLFRHYGFLDLGSVLEEICDQRFLSPDDLENAWNELVRNDEIVRNSRGNLEFAFQAALSKFSYYSDVVVEGGNNKNKFGALDPPEPAAITAERFKPTILGQPTIPEGTELFESGYHSFLPAYIRTNVGPDNPTFLMVIILRKNVDWAKQDNEEKPYVANLNLRISFQNKKTLRLTEFLTYFKFELSQEEFNKRDNNNTLVGSLVTRPVALPYFDGEKLALTLGETLKQLEPGEYVVNIYLQHTLTKKYNAWREETVIK